ncbi:MAG: hypothetical protein ABIW79_03690 [Gemmatimonas sp.]
MMEHRGGFGMMVRRVPFEEASGEPQGRAESISTGTGVSME